jgi:DNA (cytosine-5)-methyltransferase 3A
MNVLSCFDGISCGQIALQRAKIKVKDYYASEINKDAITITQLHFPNTLQVGSIQKLSAKALPKIDLLIGGSPCQGFSYSGKGLNFSDHRSALFFEFIRLINECKPKYFLLENVCMRKEWQNVISNFIGVEPIYINSKLVSAQDRKRLYWTNIPDITLPTDKETHWEDVCDDGWYAGAMRGRRLKNGKRDDYNMSIPIVQYIESRYDNYTNCLSTVAKDNVASEKRVGRVPSKEVKWRYFTQCEMERLQTLPAEYTKSVSYHRAVKLIGNAWTVDVVAHILKHI